MAERRFAATLALLMLVGGCGDDDPAPRSATATPVATATRTATAPGATPTASVAPPTATAVLPSPTPTTAVLPPSTPTATATATSSADTPTPTATPILPVITYFGIARADDLAIAPQLTDDAGRPVFVRAQGQAMTIILEARQGLRPLAVSAYDPSAGQRGVEFLVSRPLGDGSPAVCDVLAPNIGGVPAVDPPAFSSDAEVQRAIDDLGCRVNDGSGSPVGRSAINACTRMDPTFEYGFVGEGSQLQYCLPIARAWSFPVGDTIVAARVRDVSGTFSIVREIVVRVEPEAPFACDQGLGVRSFAVRRPPSRLVSSSVPIGDGSADPWAVGTLRLCSGRELEDGTYPLNLREDAEIGLPLADGGVLCLRLIARGSGGVLACNGGEAADVLAEQAIGGQVNVDSGIGLDAGTGAAIINIPMSYATLAPGAAPDDCADADYGPIIGGALTTATGTARLLDNDAALLAEVAAQGASFDCARWTEPGTGRLILPLPISGAAIPDRATVLVLSD